MIRKIIVLATAAAALAAAAPADAKVRCKLYDTRWPGVTELRASNAGCTSAWGVADAIKDGWAKNEKLPPRVEAVDRTWRCAYKMRQGETNPYVKAICRSGRRTIGMVLA